jgi:hypothetical protein
MEADFVGAPPPARLFIFQTENQKLFTTEVTEGTEFFLQQGFSYGL